MGDGDNHIRAMDREALPTDAAGAEHDGATARFPVKADGSDDGLVESIRPAVGLDLMADLNSGIDGMRCSASENGPIGQEHRRAAVVAVVGVPSFDEGLAGGGGVGESGLFHDRQAIRERAEPCIARVTAALTRRDPRGLPLAHTVAFDLSRLGAGA
jgi:hypothetical protein